MSHIIHCTRIETETEEAICVYVLIPGMKGTSEKLWFPLSQVDSIHRGDKPYIVVSDWIAKKKGFK